MPPSKAEHVATDTLRQLFQEHDFASSASSSMAARLRLTHGRRCGSPAVATRQMRLAQEAQRPYQQASDDLASKVSLSLAGSVAGVMGQRPKTSPCVQRRVPTNHQLVDSSVATLNCRQGVMLAVDMNASNAATTVSTNWHAATTVSSFDGDFEASDVAITKPAGPSLVKAHRFSAVRAMALLQAATAGRRSSDPAGDSQEPLIKRDVGDLHTATSDTGSEALHPIFDEVSTQSLTKTQQEISHTAPCAWSICPDSPLSAHMAAQLKSSGSGASISASAASLTSQCLNTSKSPDASEVEQCKAATPSTSTSYKMDRVTAIKSDSTAARKGGTCRGRSPTPPQRHRGQTWRATGFVGPLCVIRRAPKGTKAAPEKYYSLPFTVEDDPRVFHLFDVMNKVLDVQRHTMSRNTTFLGLYFSPI